MIIGCNLYLDELRFALPILQKIICLYGTRHAAHPLTLFFLFFLFLFLGPFLHLALSRLCIYIETGAGRCISL
jgi:hypothetical protein